MRRVDVRNALIRRRQTSIHVSEDIRAPETGLSTCLGTALGCQQEPDGILYLNIKILKFMLICTGYWKKGLSYANSCSMNIKAIIYQLIVQQLFTVLLSN